MVSPPDRDQRQAQLLQIKTQHSTRATWCCIEWQSTGESINLCVVAYYCCLPGRELCMVVFSRWQGRGWGWRRGLVLGKVLRFISMQKCTKARFRTGRITWLETCTSTTTPMPGMETTCFSLAVEVPQVCTYRGMSIGEGNLWQVFHAFRFQKDLKG